MEGASMFNKINSIYGDILKLNNKILNNKCISINNINELKPLNVKLTRKNFDSEFYLKWIKKYFPEQIKSKKYFYKKGIELFVTYQLLNIKNNIRCTYLDAAGGVYSYINYLNCNRRILQDIYLSKKMKKTLDHRIEVIESNADNIPLQNGFIDAISCHHSFEHFQNDSDIGFIKEIQRLLVYKGISVIIPIFIGSNYIEVSSSRNFQYHFDSDAEKVIDKYSTLPGGKYCGDFARIYDIKSFNKRVLNSIDYTLFHVELVEILFDGENIPDMSLKYHRKIATINYPYRALVIQKTTK